MSKTFVAGAAVRVSELFDHYYRQTIMVLVMMVLVHV
jgi:hypothetical protein